MLKNRTNLLLIGEATEVLAVWTPRNKVCISRTQLRIPLIVRDLPPLESKASVNAKRLVIEVSGIDGVCENEQPQSKSAYSVSFPTDCQLGGKLTEGMGHAGQSTASSPDDVPSIPAGS